MRLCPAAFFGGFVVVAGISGVVAQDSESAPVREILVPLKPGEIVARGWLREQLMLVKDGLHRLLGVRKKIPVLGIRQVLQHLLGLAKALLRRLQLFFAGILLPFGLAIDVLGRILQLALGVLQGLLRLGDVECRRLDLVCKGFRREGVAARHNPKGKLL